MITSGLYDCSLSVSHWLAVTRIVSALLILGGPTGCNRNAPVANTLPKVLQNDWHCTGDTYLKISSNNFMYTLNYGHPKISISGKCTLSEYRNSSVVIRCTPPVMAYSTRTIVKSINHLKCGNGYKPLHVDQISEKCANSILKGKSTKIGIAIKKTRAGRATKIQIMPSKKVCYSIKIPSATTTEPK